MRPLHRIQDHFSFNWSFYAAGLGIVAIFWTGLEYVKWKNHHYHDVSSWPMVEARVLEASFQINESGQIPTKTLGVFLKLHYQIQETNYTTTYYRKNAISPHFDLTQLSVGRQITIRYSSKDPSTISLWPWLLD